MTYGSHFFASKNKFRFLHHNFGFGFGSNEFNHFANEKQSIACETKNVNTAFVGAEQVWLKTALSMLCELIFQL